MSMADKEVEIVLFGLESDKDLRIEYPELANEEVFKDLKVKEVRLCWLLGNRTSPIYKLSKKDRLIKAVELVYGKNHDKIPDAREILSGNVPDRIRDAVNRMETYNPEYRLRAKLLSQYMFDTLNEMIVLDSVTIAGMDIDEKKKYTDLMVKVHEQLPEMVKRLETSYGVRSVDKRTKRQVMVNINDVLK
jgi:hypothetical protein